MPDHRDGLLALTLAILLGVAAYALAQLVPPFALKGFDVWFESDAGRVAANMMSLDSDHHRTSVHPLFSLMAFPPVYLARKLLSIEASTAVTVVSSVVASVWIATLFILLRLMGCRRLDSVLFSVLGAISAAAVFWLPVPETFVWGSLTILFAFCLLAVMDSHPVGSAWHVIIGTLTMSATLTNWMVGILLTFVTQHWKRALQLAVNAFCVMVLLWGLQKAVFPTAQFLLSNPEVDETTWLLHPQSGGPLNVVQSFFFHSMITPSIGLVEDAAFVLIGTDRVRLGHRLGTQFSAPGSASVIGLVAAIIWFILLVAGFIALFSVKQHRPLRIVLGLTILGQLGLHLVYGEETFLYSLHFAPLLIVLTALCTLTPMRRVVLVLTGVLIVFGGVNNWLQFVEACDLASQFTAEREIVQDAMQGDPTRLWPRGRGHVVLGEPGSAEMDKSYHEPGGSFSPRVGSFGVSLWLTDNQGTPLVTSETLPLHDIQQAFKPSSGTAGIPKIATATSHYETIWSLERPGHWELNLTNLSSATPVIVFRSVGPAGGPIKSLDWNGERLLINERWAITIQPRPTAVYLGDENSEGWMTERPSIRHWSNNSGWGYARLELGQSVVGSKATWNLEIDDSRIQMPRPAWLFAGTPLSLQANLPDPRFLESLRAQVDHLRMGLVENETRSADPVAFLRPSVRDAAYAVVALTRAGQATASKSVALNLAAQDFYGGFGAEADALGLAIWALGDVARYLDDSSYYDKWIWPHVRRKADRIMQMLRTEAPMWVPARLPAGGPMNLLLGKRSDMVLLARAAHDGLIVGQVGSDWPSLYVNGLCYRGLLDAADLALRLGEYADATNWRAQAFVLKHAWEAAFTTQGVTDNLTYGIGLWPSMVAASVAPEFHRRIASKWHENPIVKITSFRPRSHGAQDLAEAHQWLRLGDAERTWTIFESFMHNQASPGLYTWSTNSGSQPTPGLWKYVRGGSNSADITPDYRTAAELLLLQLAMLAYMDDAAPEPTVVIGAGIPKTWLSQPMSVTSFPLPHGTLDWHWDGRQMHVTIHGEPMKVRLAPTFSKVDVVQLKIDSITPKILARKEDSSDTFKLSSVRPPQ